MSITQQGFIPSSVSVTLSAAQNSKITNLAIATANTEHSLALTSNLKSVIIKARGATVLKYSFVLGESGSKYITIPVFNTREMTGLDFTGKTLYIQSTVAPIVVEIEELY